MIGAVFLTISAIASNLEINVLELSEINEIKKYTKVFVFDSHLERNYFLKSFIGGFFYYNMYDRYGPRYDAKKLNVQK